MYSPCTEIQGRACCIQRNLFQIFLVPLKPYTRLDIPLYMASRCEEEHPTHISRQICALNEFKRRTEFVYHLASCFGTTWIPGRTSSGPNSAASSWRKGSESISVSIGEYNSSSDNCDSAEGPGATFWLEYVWRLPAAADVKPNTRDIEGRSL